TEAICDAILRMAQGLELAVIAEGVETWHQHEWLRARGCDEFQGFLLARPAPFDAVLRELGEGPATWRRGARGGPPVECPDGCIPPARRAQRCPARGRV